MDLTGKRFGNLVVMKKSLHRAKNLFFWECKCDCGKTVRLSENRLFGGKALNCSYYCTLIPKESKPKKINKPYSQRKRQHPPLTKYLYLVINPAWSDYVKIGRADDVNKRKESYQTGSPYRDYEIIYYKKFSDIYLAEKHINKKFDAFRDREWFNISKEGCNIQILTDFIENLEI